MNKNMLNTMFKCMVLKEKNRTGWEEVGIPENKVETLAEHCSGSMLLSILIKEETGVDFDLLKVMEMILVSELTKLNSDKEKTPVNNVIMNDSSEGFIELTEGLKCQDKLLELLKEYNSQESIDAKYALMIKKLESDIQAKKYELDGDFKLENAVADAKKFVNADEIVPNIKKASDSWILYDKKYYKDNELFELLSKEIQEY